MITLPPRSAISVMVGAFRSIRDTSATAPSCIGTLKSTRTSTRLPLTSASSRLRKDFTDWRRHEELGAAASGELAHRHRSIDHAVGETPLIVVPRHHANQRAVDHLGLVHVE